MRDDIKTADDIARIGREEVVEEVVGSGLGRLHLWDSGFTPITDALVDSLKARIKQPDRVLDIVSGDRFYDAEFWRKVDAASQQAAEDQRFARTVITQNTRITPRTEE